MSVSYLQGYLMEVGPTAPGGFGPAPLSHQELLAWQINMRRMLQPWEISMLRRLSAEWISESQRAEAHDASPPWDGGAVTAEERGRVADSLRDMLDGMGRS